MVKVQKDNVVLSIKEEDLAQYETRGYKKIEEVSKETSSTNKKVEKKVK